MLICEKVPRYSLRKCGVVQMLRRAAVYVDGGTADCFLRILGMCLQCGRGMQPCRASNSCDVRPRTYAVDLDVQRAMSNAVT